MRPFYKNLMQARALLAALLVMVSVIAVMRQMKRENNPAARPAPPATKTPLSYHLSPLGTVPVWGSLSVYDGTMTREEFEMSLSTVFTCSEEWKKYFYLSADHVLIRTMAGKDDEFFRLAFATEKNLAIAAPKSWRAAATMPKAFAEGKPLEGVHIAIDAGHIGGAWAQMEERWFRMGEAMPVTEGDMTLRVAWLLKPELERLGAKVSLVRERAEPLTKDRPDALVATHVPASAAEDDPAHPLKDAESLFYRTSEIRARAAKVNQEIKPDVVLCLHFNAAAWGDPANPQLVEANHFHILLNGAYTDDELSYDDQRLEMTRKILQRTIDEEAALGAVMARVFVEQTGLPPYPYEGDSHRARNINGNPYLWARNLIANRLYDCPVIFFEPYVMNSVEFHQRVQLGDYDGWLDIAGKPRLSIYREYTKAVVDGLVAYYREERVATR